MEEMRNFYVSLPTREVYFDESDGDQYTGFIISATEDEARDLESYMREKLSIDFAQDLKVLASETMHFNDDDERYRALTDVLGRIYDLGTTQTKAQIQNLGVLR